MNPIYESYFQSDLFGKGIFLALLGLSIVTWVIFLTKWLYQKDLRKKASLINESFLKKRSNPLTCDLPFSDHPLAIIYNNSKQQALQLLNKNRSASKENDRVFLSRSDIELIDSSLSPTLSRLVKTMEKNLFVLSTIVSLAPFLGLLGTVWGILLTFSHLQKGGGSHALVMDGLAMALGTTVVGLLVAIPALIAYNYLRAVVLRFSHELNDFSQTLLVSIEINYRKVDVE